MKDLQVTFKYTKNNFLMNPFSLRLQQDVLASMKDFDKTPGFVLGQNNHHLLSEHEKYTSRVFRIQAALTKTSEQLLHIKIFINRYPFRQYYLEQGISQLEYVQYHTEVLFHKVHTILEIMRLLVNEVYQLSIPSKECSWISLCKKLRKNESPMKCLELYFKAFENLIDLRHLNSHRGYYEDEEKDKIDLEYGLFFYKEEYNGYTMDQEFKAKIPIGLINLHLKEHKKRKVKLVDMAIIENEKHLTKFLSSLLIQYELQLLKLGKPVT